MRKVQLGKPFLKKEIILEEIGKVLDSRWISGGPKIEEFETKVKEYNDDLGKTTFGFDGHYVAVSSATTGLELALQLANGRKRFYQDDEVIVPSWSWVASGFVVYNVGGTPVWCDVDKYGVPYAEDIEKRITSKTRAILLVHQMGIPCDMDKINALSEKYNIPIVEDSACAFGSEYKGIRVGVSNNIGVYSFQARKCLTTGEGGMVVVRTKEDSEWLKSMRAFGTTISPLERDKVDYLLKESFDKIGTNYKFNDIQAAMGIAHLSYFDEEVSRREKVGKYYDFLIEDIDGVESGNLIPDYCTRYNWQNYHVILDEIYDRDSVVDKLRKRGIGSKWDIQAIHYEPVVGSTLPLVNTSKFHDHGLWIPFWAELRCDDQDYVIENLKETLDEIRRT